MQRLFSTFANGWPGFGLLMQRLVLGTALLYHGAALLRGGAALGPVAPTWIASLLGFFILAGLWTPAAGALIAAVQTWIALASSRDPFTAMLLAMLGATLAMIGPGAWSIDARLFGRKYLAG